MCLVGVSEDGTLFHDGIMRFGSCAVVIRPDKYVCYGIATTARQLRDMVAFVGKAMLP
jgi:hypothetical protein